MTKNQILKIIYNPGGYKAYTTEKYLINRCKRCKKQYYLIALDIYNSVSHTQAQKYLKKYI